QSNVIDGVGRFSANRMAGAGEGRLIRIALANLMCAPGSYVSDLPHQSFRQFALQVQAVALEHWRLEILRKRHSAELCAWRIRRKGRENWRRCWKWVGEARRRIVERDQLAQHSERLV